jgi:lipoprotein-anchoring transpeptidase ErfK/SrfK
MNAIVIVEESRMSRTSINAVTGRVSAAVLFAGVLLAGTAASGQSLGYAPSSGPWTSIFGRVAPDRPTADGARDITELPSHLRRQVVAYRTAEAPGTVIVDTPNTRLYYVLGGGRAISYGIGVGREGFTWSGVQSIARKVEWPDWIPPQEMLQRQPYLPRFMAGGPGNPLGARALYLGGTIYRIHGTNAPETIGGHVSSGCIRMMNADVIDLYGRVGIGTKVVVLPDKPRASASAQVMPVRGRSIAEARPATANAGGFRAFGLY